LVDGDQKNKTSAEKKYFVNFAGIFPINIRSEYNSSSVTSEFLIAEKKRDLKFYFRREIKNRFCVCLTA
jgi:hypothetical protein